MRLTARWPIGLRSAVAATAVLGIALTLATFALEDRALRGRFDRMADLVSAAMQQRLAQYVAILRATRSYLEAENGQITPAEFSTYVDHLQLGVIAPGVQGIGVATLIPISRTADADAALSRIHRTPIPVYPATDQAVRAPIALLEPQDPRNRTALGYDMYVEPIRRAAIAAALDSSDPQASGPVELVQEVTADKQTGFLLYLRSSSRLAELPSDRDLVYAPFRAGDLHRAVLADLPQLPLTLRSFDLGAPDKPLYNGTPADTPRRLKRLTTLRIVRIAGRQWQMAITPTPAFLNLRDRSATVTVGLMSLLLISAVWAAMGSQARSLGAARHAAAMAERQAADRALLLREMQHRIKNHIARIQAIARHSMRGAADMDEFQKVFNGRLSAMAKAQDAIGRDAKQSADLRTLLLAELTQVLSLPRAEAALGGPTVALDARETQAVGLVAHELLTNLMKYRDLEDADHETPVEGLRVNWRIAPRADRPWLNVEWFEPAASASSEAASGVRPPSSSTGGFGTQLIEALVEGDLGGSFDRSFGAEGMRVTLAFPLSHA